MLSSCHWFLPTATSLGCLIPPTTTGTRTKYHVMVRMPDDLRGLRLIVWQTRCCTVVVLYRKTVVPKVSSKRHISRDGHLLYAIHCAGRRFARAVRGIRDWYLIYIGNTSLFNLSFCTCLLLLSLSYIFHSGRWWWSSKIEIIHVILWWFCISDSS